MKILLVGLGSIGRRHLKNLAALGVRQRAAVTRNRCVLPQDGLPVFLPFDTVDAALTWLPDVVFVCNPTAFHLETALEAARAGCHLFLEKPVSHTPEGLDELAELVEKQGIKVQVGFQFRFHPVFQKIKKSIERGDIGRIVSAHAHWGEYLPGWHPWEDYRTSYSAREDLGGGVVLTLCHPFDYLRWMLGEAEVVSAVGGQLSDLEMNTEDVALVSLRFESGAIGSVYLDYISKPAKHTLQIVGTKGRIEWDANDGGARIYYAPGEEYALGFESISPGKFFERNEMFLAEVADFLDCIRNDRTPACNLNDGIRALEIALAAKSSLQEHQEECVP
ncbi:MAG: gfo/Idh/MocA family oxidoreductase [Haliscomenobacteraceae bacterium CHB4]|nr:gfo/Idh/MocA family oxidoreductase [Haliscomenobacteraceae bacterium CHB4]